MTTTTHTHMTRLGQATVAEILGKYEALLDAKHDLEIETLTLMNSGVSHWSERALMLSQARRDVERKLSLYAGLATESELLMGVPA